MSYERIVVGGGMAELYLGDCIEVMADMAEKSVDMIWTDPPYGHSNNDGDLNASLAERSGRAVEAIANDGPDEMRAVVSAMLNHAARILPKASCCCCCCCGGGGPSPTFAWLAQRMDAEGLQLFHSVIWDKVRPGLGWRYKRQHEMVMVAHRAGGKLLWRDTNVTSGNIIACMPPQVRSHPNEKPVMLPERFIRLHATAGNVVMDPFMGSGTTGVAAARCGVKFIGVEMDPRHFDFACRTIDHAYAQGNMFRDETVSVKQDKLFA